MKRYIKILPICLSIFIFVFSVLQCNISAYASEGVYPSGSSKLEKVFTEASSYLVYLATRVEAIVNGDFAKWVQNREDYIEWWNTGHISYDEKTDSILFDEDLVKYIKQALKEYAEETSGFIILPTVPISTVTPSTFTNSYQYQTVKSMVNEYGVLFIRPSSSYLRVGDASSYINGEAGFYIINDYSSYYIVNLMDLKEWSNISYFDKCIQMQPSYDKAIHTWEEAESSASSSDGLYYYTVSSDKASCNIGTIRVNKSGVYDFSPNCINLLSKDGRRVHVFKSDTALINYSVEHRTVYFGSKFYEDTGSVTATYDDFEKWMDGKYDNLIDDFRDIIGDETISEDELEKLLEDFLNKFFDRLEESGGGSGGGISSAVTEWIEKIYDKLKDIEKVLKKIKNWTILDTLFDAADAIADWLDLIHDIISDVDSGAESAVKTLSSALDDSMSLMKKKFPFSVPWDILFFVTVFSAEPETPHFEVPIDFTVSSLGPDNLIEIHYDFVIDFTDYQYLSDIFRTVLSMIYAVGLIKLTSGIVTTNKEE